MIKTNELPNITTFADTDGFVVDASTGTGRLTGANAKKYLEGHFAIDAHNAASHNGIYRGKDLTSYFESGGMSNAIAASTFDDIYIGDYITKTVTVDETTYTNAKWLVAALDTHLQCGDTATTAHHVVLIADRALQVNVSMNDTDTTEGGYLGSKMWTEHIPKWVTGIKTAFGASHVLTHRESLTNSMNATAPSAAGANFVGSSTNWTWTNVDVNILNELMIYGGTIFSSSGFDVGDFNMQLPLFTLKNNYFCDRSWFWLRAVASASYFCFASNCGYANYCHASYSHASGGIRPYFLFR